MQNILVLRHRVSYAEIIRRIEIEQIPVLYLFARMFVGSGDVNEDGVKDTVAQAIEKSKSSWLYSFLGSGKRYD